MSIFDVEIFEHAGHEAWQSAGRGRDAGPCRLVDLLGGGRVEGGHERLVAVDGGEGVLGGGGAVLAPDGDALVAGLLLEPLGDEHVTGDIGERFGPWAGADGAGPSEFVAEGRHVGAGPVQGRGVHVEGGRLHLGPAALTVRPPCGAQQVVAPPVGKNVDQDQAPPVGVVTAGGAQRRHSGRGHVHDRQVQPVIRRAVHDHAQAVPPGVVHGVGDEFGHRQRGGFRRLVAETPRGARRADQAARHGHRLFRARVGLAVALVSRRADSACRHRHRSRLGQGAGKSRAGPSWGLG